MPTYTLQIDLDGDLLDQLDALRKGNGVVWSRETCIRMLIKHAHERSDGEVPDHTLVLHPQTLEMLDIIRKPRSGYIWSREQYVDQLIRDDYKPSDTEREIRREAAAKPVTDQSQPGIFIPLPRALQPGDQWSFTYNQRVTEP